MNPNTKDWAAEARAQLGIALPMTVTMFAQLAISAVETLIVARLGIDVLAGVTLALGVYGLVFLFALGVVTAITPIAALARGRGDIAGLRRSGQQGLWVGLTFAVPGMAILLGCGLLLAHVLGNRVEGAAARDYLLGAAWGLPAWVCYVAVRSLAVAMGQIRITTAIMLAALPLHAGLSVWLVFGGLGLPPLGAFGAGLAYALSAAGAWVLLAVFVRRAGRNDFSAVFRRPFVWDAARYRDIVRLGLPFACRIMLREGVLPAAAFAIAPFGTAAVAAHAAAARLVELAGVLSFGFSDGANVRVGHALGAGRPAQARRAGLVAIQLAAVISVLVAAMLAAGSGRVAHWVLGDAAPASTAALAKLLPVAAGMLFLECVQSGAGGTLAGMRDAKGPLLIAIVGAWLVGMPLGLLLARVVTIPVLGLWLGLATGSGLTTVLYILRFHQRIAHEQRKPPG